MKYFRLMCLLPVLLLVFAGCKIADPVIDDDTINYFDINLGDKTIEEMVVSPEGSKIAILGYSHNGMYDFVNIYDIKTQAKLWGKIIEKNSTYWKPINFSQDGEKLLFQLSFDSAVVVNSWNGTSLSGIGKIANARLFPDGETVAGISQYHYDPNFTTIPPVVSIYSVRTGDKIKDLTFTGTDGWGPENWEIVGTSGTNNIVLFNNITYNNVPTLQIVYWDIYRDIKTSNAYFGHARLILAENDHLKIFSPDFSVIALNEDNTGCFFYNTLTGGKINTTPFVRFRFDKEKGFIYQTFVPMAIANNKTYAIQEKNEDNTNKSQSPILYSQNDLKRITELPMPTGIVDSVKTQFFKFSGNNAILAKVISSNVYPHENNNPAIIRIWKLK